MELDTNPNAGEFVETNNHELEKQDVILLFAAKNEIENQALILKRWILEKN